VHSEGLIKRNTWRVIVTAVLVIAAFVIRSPHADASIVVEGDDAFKESISECLDTYRNAEGIVGEVIRELEDSDNEHKIVQSPDWSSAPNDWLAAQDGTGTGTETRVDADALEGYKEDIPALKDKDFCTGLLHELWHAIDSDRGTRSPSADKLGGVKRNEVEATIFQNFIHAIRGVAPRTVYGGVDISEFVLIGDDPVEEPATTSSTAPPTTTTTTAPPQATTTTAPPQATTTTAPPQATSKTVSFDLPCPQPVGGQSFIDVNIPADAVNPTHVVSPNPWTCPNTNVSVSGQVTSPGVYRVTFTATGGSGAPDATVSTTVTVNWTNP